MDHIRAQVFVLLVVGLIGAAAYFFWQRRSFFKWIEEGEKRLKSKEVAESHVALESLPLPLRNYLRRVNPENRQARWVQFQQSGVMIMKEGGPEAPFRATQVIPSGVPGFSWVANVRMAPFMSAIVCDRFDGETGDLEARLWGAIRVAKLSGPEALKGEMMRWMAEIPWNPTLIPQHPELQWRQTGEAEVELTAYLKGVEAKVTFEFDSDGLITRVRAEDRPRDVGGQARPTPWEGLFSEYRRVEGLLIPTHAEVRWIIDAKPFTYFRGDVIRFGIE